MSEQQFDQPRKPPPLYVYGFLFNGNPSPVGGGYVVVDSEGQLLARHTMPRPGMTSNEAVLRGVRRALCLAPHYGTVITSSQTVKRWVRAGHSPARTDLKGVIRATKRMRGKKRVKIKRVSVRSDNLAAVYADKHPPRLPKWAQLERKREYPQR